MLVDIAFMDLHAAACRIATKVHHEAIQSLGSAHLSVCRGARGRRSAQRRRRRRRSAASSPTAQRRRLAASRKLQEELDRRADSSDPQVAAKTPQDDHYSLSGLTRCLPATRWTSTDPVATATARSEHLGRVESPFSIASRSCAACSEADFAPVVLCGSEVYESM